jgi:ribose transport system permease protein
VILITLLQSILSVLQPQAFFAEYGLNVPAETVRQVVFGIVIIGMLLLYARERLVR